MNIRNARNAVALILLSERELRLATFFSWVQSILTLLILLLRTVAAKNSRFDELLRHRFDTFDGRCC